MIRSNRDGVWLGLDIGGTKIAGGIVTFPDAALIARQQIPTRPARAAQSILDDCLALVRELQTAASSRIRGIGIGVPELVDLNGHITSAATLPGQNFDLRGALTNIAPTLVESDVRAAAFAEAHYGAGKPFGAFAYLTVGTGISACLVQNGVPYAGARGNALVLGSSKLKKNGGEEFILERVASGLAVVERYNEIAETHVSSGDQVLRALDDGDSNAEKIVFTAADALGLGIALYVNLLDPEAVIVGGGLGSADGVYWERAIISARELIYANNARDLPILHAALGADAGIVGAAALARKHFGDGA